MRYISLCLYFIYFCSLTSWNSHAEALIAQNSDQKITIVGAGLSGLTAAYRLQQFGCSPTIYEARMRPGGRVFTAYFENSYAELGGKNINDGEGADNLLALIDELGLQTKTQTVCPERLFVFHEKLYTYPELFQEAPQPTETLLMSLKEKVKEVKNLGELIDSFFGNFSPLRHLLELTMRSWEGSDSYCLAPDYIDISFWMFYEKYHRIAKELLFGKPFPLQMQFVEGGNSVLINALCHALVNPVHYNRVLKRIGKNGDKIELHFNTEEIVPTDYLILTLPCSTLRDVTIEEGLIPEDQWHAICTLQYGTNAKILLPISLKKEISPQIITENLVTFINYDSSILVWYYGGASGVFDSHSPESLKQVVAKDIAAIRLAAPYLDFPKGLSPTPVKEKLFSHYEGPIGISWTCEEFSKGSYCNYSPEQFSLFHEMSQDYEEPVRTVFRSIEGKIFFAGEHTALDVPATMEGAVQSGERAARMVNRALLRSCPKT